MAAAAGVGLYPVVATGGAERLVSIGGAFAVLALIGGVSSGTATLVPWAVAALGGEYAVWLTLRGGGVDTRSPLYAAGLLLVAELAYWALDRRSLAVPDVELEVRRALRLLVALAASIAVGAALLAASAASVGGGVALEAVGVAAAVALLLLVARLAWVGKPDEEKA